ncbi:sensor histidine kinase [Desulfonatronum thioautotrophicum]|uniref:sensor histidine kinase n=1 Tax=Desulfonatronum thioautotrophicum TaxID=617001 RepID=UPI0005EAE7DA|nr:PAS domain-containing sensor histidine kinase [Desulfonatronum thioautotrophicum]
MKRARRRRETGNRSTLLSAARIHEYQVHQIELELQNEELRATQLHLEEVRDQYTELFNNAPAGYLIVNARGLITKANQTFARMIGREGHVFSDRQLTDLVFPEDRPALLGRFKAFFKSPEGKQLDFRLFGPHDQTIHVRCVGRPDMLAKALPKDDENDADQKLLLMVSDITDQVRSDEALKQSEKKYRELVENAPMGIFQSTQEGRYHTINAEMARLCGYPTAKEMIETVTNIATQLYARPEDRKFYKKKLLAQGEVKNFEVELVRRDGTTFWASMNTRMKHGKDGEVVFDGFLLDVTERKLLEDEVHRSNAELKALLAEKDKFFSIIAHDLKSPMSGLLGLAKIFAEEAERMTIQELREISDAMCKSTERLYALLENLLHWALVQQGLMGFSPRQINLLKLVHNSIESLRSVAELKGISIQNAIPENLKVMVDQPMITTVVRNLVSNALKYSSSGGALTISGFLNGDKVEMAVRDTGIGMDQNTQAHLFALDRKTIRPGTQGEHGTGLGLILCKEFITRHGGRIWVESELGRGTTFHFTVPARALSGENDDRSKPRLECIGE